MPRRKSTTLSASPLKRPLDEEFTFESPGKRRKSTDSSDSQSSTKRDAGQTRSPKSPRSPRASGRQGHDTGAPKTPTPKKGKPKGGQKEEEEDQDTSRPQSPGSSGSEKRNLSLEALFQVTDSELQNMTRQVPETETEVGVGDRVIVLTADNIGSIHYIISESTEPAQNMVKIPVSEKGVEKYHLKSDSLEEQGLKLVYTKPSFDQAGSEDGGSSSSSGQLKIKSSRDKVSAVEQQPTTSVGRKRKHPQKPGRHICSYCGRGCAKPSVLQKHIRAHTGERPYPCVTCGFSFKTKSNLYKHCKSRAHALKVGLGTNGADEKEKEDENVSVSEITEEIIEDESEDSEGTETDEEVVEEKEEDPTQVIQILEESEPHQSTDASSTAEEIPWRKQTLLADIRQKIDRNKLMEWSKNLEKQKKQESDAMLQVHSQFPVKIAPKDLVSQMESAGGAQMSSSVIGIKPLAPTPITAGKPDVKPKQSQVMTPVVEMTDPTCTETVVLDEKPPVSNLSDSTHVTSKQTVDPTLVLSAEMVSLPHPSTEPEAATKALRDLENLSDRFQSAAHEGIALSAAVNSLPDKSVQVTIHLPKHVAQGKVKSLPKLQRGSTLPNTVSPGSGKSSAVDSKNVTPEMLKERIQQLIQANAAIVDMPMADPPRAKSKGLTRQYSDFLIHSWKLNETGAASDASSSKIQIPSISSVPLLPIQGEGESLQRQDGVEDRSKADETPKVVTEQGAEQSHNKHLESIKEAVRRSSTSSSDGDVVRVLPSTSSGQEIKIQINLAKFQSENAFKSQKEGGLVKLETDPRIGKTVQIDPVLLQSSLSAISKLDSNQESSVIKDLLLKGNRTATSTVTHSDSKLSQTQSNEIGNRTSEDDYGPYLCKDCNVSFKKDQTLKVHKKLYCPFNSHENTQTTEMSVSGVEIKAEEFAVIGKEIISKYFPKPGPVLMRSQSAPAPDMLTGIDHKPAKTFPEVWYPKKKGRPKGSKNRPKDLQMLSTSHSSKLLAPANPVTSTTQIIPASPHTPHTPVITPKTPNNSTSTSLVTSQAPILLASLQAGPLIVPTTTVLAGPSNTNNLSSLMIGQPMVSVQGQTNPSVEAKAVPTGQMQSPLTPQTPGTPGTPQTPTSSDLQSLWKLKLKGKLLMKRSMSVERMLSQEKEVTTPTTPGTVPVKLKFKQGSLCVEQEHSASKIPKLSDNEHTGLFTWQPPVITTVAPKTQSSHNLPRFFNLPNLKLLTDDAKSGSHEILRVTIGDAPSQLTSNAVVPVVVAQPFFLNSQIPSAVYAQSLASVNLLTGGHVQHGSINIPGFQMTLPTASAKNFSCTPTTPHPKTPVSGPSALLSAGFKIDTFSSQSEKGVNTTTTQQLKAKLERQISVPKSVSPTPTAKTPGTEVKPIVSKQIGVPMVSGSSAIIGKQLVVPVLSSPRVSPTVSPATTPTPTFKEPQTLSPKTVPLYLYGHSYPSLRGSTHVTFCCVHKLQPIYVPMSKNKKISMYSNWKVAKHNPNPPNLSSKMLLSLYKSRYTSNPVYSESNFAPPNGGILTHSSYWTYKKKKQDMSRSQSEESSDSKENKADNLPEIITNTEELKEPVYRLQNEKLVAKKEIKGVRRVQVCRGGFKTNEEYIYVRGRGRGKYVCEICGIRCKKPSMLKKHIRTHTDFRPYHCRHCRFSFKTKGNLTKHMKSKAHQKKCLEIGVVPVPLTVDESQIDSEALAAQSAVAKEARIRDAAEAKSYPPGQEEEDDDEDEEDDDDDMDDDEDGDENGDDLSNHMVVEDEMEVSAVEETCTTSREGEKELSPPVFVAVQVSDSDQPALVQITPGASASNSLSSVLSLATCMEVQSSSTTMSQLKELSTSQKIDAEIARSLLDLSKKAEAESGDDQGSSSISADTQKGVTRLNSLIGALMSRTKPLSGLKPGGDNPSLTLKGLHESDSTQLNTGPRASVQLVTPTTPKGFEGNSRSLGIPLSPLEKTSPKPGDKSFPVRLNSPKTPNLESGLKALPAMQMSMPIITKPSLLGFLPAYAAISKDLVTRTGTGPIVGQFIRQEPIVLPNYSHSWGYKLPKLSESFQFSHPFPGVIGCAESIAEVVESGGLKSASSVDVESTSTRASSGPAVTPQTPTIIPLTEVHAVQIVVNEGVDVSSTVDSAADDMGNSSAPVAGETTEAAAEQETGDKSRVGLVPVQELLSPGFTSALNSPTVIKEGAVVLRPPESGASTPQQQIVYFIGDSPTLGVEKEGPHSCDVCGKSFQQQHQLGLHRNIHFMDKPFRCSVCSMQFKNQRLLEKHEKSDAHVAKHELKSQQEAAIKDDPRPYKCVFCCMAFRIRGHLSKHLRSKLHLTTLERLKILREGAFDSDNSGDITKIDASNPQNVMKYLEGKAIDDYQGSPKPSTSKDTEDEDDNEDDMEDEGELMIDETISEDGKKERRESRGSPVNEHFQVHKVSDYEKHDQASNERVTVEIKQEPLDIFEIGHSNSESQQYGGDADTESTGARETQASPGVTDAAAAAHKCGICRQNFHSLNQLRSHLITHAELRPYVCEYCDAGFTNAIALQKHLQTHRMFESFTLSQSRPYICGLCGDTFAKSDELKTHHATHSKTTLLRPSLRESFVTSQTELKPSCTSQIDPSKQSQVSHEEAHPREDNSQTCESKQGDNSNIGITSFQAGSRENNQSGEIERVDIVTICKGDQVIDEIKVHQRKTIQRQFSVDETDKSVGSDQDVKEENDSVSL